MFKARRAPTRLVPGPHRFEAHASCRVDVPPDEAWERVADLSIPLKGDHSHVESGLLPGHQMGMGAIGYAITKTDHGALVGTVFEVIAWEPPHRYAVRLLLQEQEKTTIEVAWRVDPGDGRGSVIHFAERLDILIPADPRRLETLQANVDRAVAEVGARVPHSFA